MALTSAQETRAKTRAKQWLEYSIYTLGLMLPDVPDDVDSSFVNPATESDGLYTPYDCLIKMCKAYEQIP